MQQRFEQMRRIYPADLAEILEAAEIEQMQLSAIKAYAAAARSGPLHTLSADGVTTEHWQDPPHNPAPGE